MLVGDEAGGFECGSNPGDWRGVKCQSEVVHEWGEEVGWAVQGDPERHIFGVVVSDKCEFGKGS